MYVKAVDRTQTGAVLDELGFDYRRDPMGRLFLGEWVRPEGPNLDSQRFSDHVGKLILISDKEDNKKLRGSRNPVVRDAIKRGRVEHDKLKEKVLKKPGWKSDRLLRKEGVKSGIRSDVITPRGRTMELKPDTPSGRAAAKKQTERYRKFTNKGSRAIFYRPYGGVPIWPFNWPRLK